MVRLTLIKGFLLLAGIFLVDIYAESFTSAPIQFKAQEQALTNTIAPKAAPSNTTTHAPSNTTTHAPSNTTTHAPSNTTTHAPSNTTTHAPSNTTTHAPSNTTTHAPSNTTTHVPSNTTTHAPSNTTTHSTTHTTPVLPTKPSPPTSGNYIVKDAKGTCIIADMGLELELENSTTAFQATKSKNKWYFNVNPKETRVNGTCDESRASLLLEFPAGFIHFVFVKEKKIYYIDEVSVKFTWNSAEHWNGTAGKLKLLSTDAGYSVKCKNTPTVKLAGNLQLVMSDVKLQAFDIKNGALGKEAVCSYDRNIIAVAISVTVLIIIIIGIIVYFICRKKRSSGYQRL